MKRYFTKRMFDDLRCDFNRYKHALGFKGNLSFWQKIYILYKCPIIYAIMSYRFCRMANSYLEYNSKNIVWHILNIIAQVGGFLSVVFFKTMISEQAQVKPGLFLSNKGNIIVGAKKIGRGCTVLENVTIGMGIGIGSNYQAPEIGDNVVIGSNSLIFGDIKIGNNSIIEKSTVISRSISERCFVGGNPGRILKRNIVTPE